MIAALWVGCHPDRPAHRPDPPAPEDVEVTDIDPQHPFVDDDRDGAPATVDCDDHDASVYPGADEWCDGKDNDCDGAGDADDDGDGTIWCFDCVDSDASYHPGADDPLGDGLDQDCDGTDGVGEPLPDPTWLPGFSEVLSFGLTMAAGDVDADGCADLLVGAPGETFAGYWDSVTLATGCWPAKTATTRRGGALHHFGWTVDVRADKLVANEYGVGGRALLFDDPPSPDDSPELEILGAYGEYQVNAVALLGVDAEWLLVGSQGWGPYPGRYSLFDTQRRGAIDLAEGGLPDYEIYPGILEMYTGSFVADVGDRNGDGLVDLGLAMMDPGHNSLHFFPSVTTALIDDAPEIWHGEADPGKYTGRYTGGRADLDGDGLDDALSANVAANGAQLLAGRVYVVPFLGFGEFWLEDDALARVEGELTYEFLGGGMATGDLDGDGQDDLVVGAPGNATLIPFTGRVDVFLGPVSGILTRADADRVWVGDLGDYAGHSLAVGDFDGSGKADLAIGAPYRDGPDDADDEGAVYLLFDPL